MSKPDQQVIEESWQKFKAADNYNRLRLGDAATELLEICHMIERLPASPLQTDISLKASELRRRMAEQTNPPREQVMKTLDDVCHLPEEEWAAKLSNEELADELIANLWADVPARERKKAAVLEAAIDRLRVRRGQPKIICLCGSTRFSDTWISEYQRLSDDGNIVLTVARMPPRPNLQHDDPALKRRLDDLHCRKIDLADEVFVLNVGGYVGESTRSEIVYAEALGKPVRYLQPLNDQAQRQPPKAGSERKGNDE